MYIGSRLPRSVTTNCDYPARPFSDPPLQLSRRDILDMRKQHTKSHVSIASFHDWTDRPAKLFPLQRAATSKLYQEVASLSTTGTFDSGGGEPWKPSCDTKHLLRRNIFQYEGPEFTKGEKQIIAGLCRNRGCKLPHLDFQSKNNVSDWMDVSLTGMRVSYGALRPAKPLKSFSRRHCDNEPSSVGDIRQPHTAFNYFNCPLYLNLPYVNEPLGDLSWQHGGRSNTPTSNSDARRKPIKQKTDKTVKVTDADPLPSIPRKICLTVYLPSAAAVSDSDDDDNEISRHSSRNKRRLKSCQKSRSEKGVSR